MGVCVGKSQVLGNCRRSSHTLAATATVARAAPAVTAVIAVIAVIAVTTVTTVATVPAVSSQVLDKKPVAYLTCNGSPPADGKPSLMT